jgi:hypothetical protein
MSTSEEATMDVGETAPIEKPEPVPVENPEPASIETPEPASVGTPEPASIETPEHAPAPAPEPATPSDPIPSYAFAFGTAAEPLPLPKPPPIPATNAPLPHVFCCLGIVLRKLCPQWADDGPRLLTPSSHAFMTTIFQRVYEFGIKNYADAAGFDVLDGSILGDTIRDVLRNMFHDVEDLVMLAQQSGELEAMELDAKKRKSMQSYLANLEGFTPLVNNLFRRHGYVGRDRVAGGNEEEAEEGEVHVMRGENGETVEVVYAEGDEDLEDDEDDDDEDDSDSDDEDDEDDDRDVYMTADEGTGEGEDEDDDEASDLALEEGELAEN